MKRLGLISLMIALVIALVGGLIVTSCAPAEQEEEEEEQEEEVTELPLTPVYLIPQLSFELDDFIGEKVWVSGYYGDSSISGSGYGFLVTDSYMLLVDEKLPDHSCIVLDGDLPDDVGTGAEVLVYGEVKDFAETYDVFTVEPTPLITVEQHYVLSPAAVATSLSVPLLDASFGTAPHTSPLAIEAYAQGDTQVKDCDRALILSGGVDAKNNHARYRENVIMKYSKLRELGFTDEQIAVLYNNGAAIDVGGTNITDAKASKQKVAETLEKFKNEMTCCCTLAILVTDHGTGYNQEQCYHGARPALDPAREGGKTYAENTLKVDLRSKVYRATTKWTTNGKEFVAAKDETGRVEVYMKQGGSWVFKGYDANGDDWITESELGEDLDGDGVKSNNTGWKVATIEGWLAGPVKHQNNEWDTDGDGNIDVRARWDGTRYVLERLKDGVWEEMARDTNGDFIINNTDGGIDWSLDGDKNDQIGFHEGINLWGQEVLWDDELADLLKPLHDKGIHILVEMVTCFGGGFVENLKGRVDKIVTYSSEDTKHWNRVAADGTIYAADQKAFVGNLTGIDPESWNTAFEKGKEADTARWKEAGSNPKTKNEYQGWEKTVRPTLDNFKCYLTEGVEFLGEAVYLEDQWGGVEAMVGWDWFFCNPVEMWHDEVLMPISHPDHHLTLYGLEYEGEPQTWIVTVDNQFGIQELTVYDPIKLGVPTQKVEPGAHEPPVCLDHFLLYKVVEGTSVDVVVGLYDQFHDEPEVLVAQPVFFANPVRKTHGGIVTEIKNPEAHLVFYEILGGVFETEVQVINQFGEQTFHLSDPAFLAIPSEMLFAAPVAPVD